MSVAALVFELPNALKTFVKSSLFLASNDTGHATLLMLVQAKNSSMCFPSTATSVNLLSGTTMRALRTTGIAQLVGDTDMTFLKANGVPSHVFSIYNTGCGRME